MTRQQKLVAAVVLWALVAGWGSALAGTALGGR